MTIDMIFFTPIMVFFCLVLPDVVAEARASGYAEVIMLMLLMMMIIILLLMLMMIVTSMTTKMIVKIMI